MYPIRLVVYGDMPCYCSTSLILSYAIMTQYCFSTDDGPNITNLTAITNSTTAILTCSYTGHPPPIILWMTPERLYSVAIKNQLIISPLGPEASGTYQCFVTNNIRCDHKEINLNVSSVSIANTSVVVIDSSSVDNHALLSSPSISVMTTHLACNQANETGLLSL